MAMIFLEALGALVVLLLIVWWTMFAGRKDGEPESEADADTGDASDETKRNT